MNTKMPCLSLWQPWATLMAIGSKKNETRSWPTSYRGLLAIHAAKKWDRHMWDACEMPAYREVLSPIVLARPRSMGFYSEGTLRASIPFGAILCVVRLVDCVRVSKPSDAPPIGSPEYEFGDYSPGRYFFRTEMVKRFEEPIPCVGRQGMFEVEVPL